MSEEAVVAVCALAGLVLIAAGVVALFGLTGLWWLFLIFGAWLLIAVVAALGS